ncbi:MAG: molecular chaperone [Vibrio sp.]
MDPLLLTLTLFGRLLSERPTEKNQELRTHLSHVTEWVEWPNRDEVDTWFASMPSENLKDLEYQFSVLFEGQGHMKCPPWGSVYQTKENIVFGESTIQYRQFMQQNGYQLDSENREPEDQFGLMLLSFCQLLTDGKNEVAQVLLTDHLMPWGQRYLELLSENNSSRFYQVVALLTKTLLNELCDEFGLKVKEVRLFL